MSASITLIHDVNNNLPGSNLKWTVANMAAMQEITLVYYKNTADANIISIDVSPNLLKQNIQNLESGISYSFQIQGTDINDLTVYSNTMVLTSAYSLAAPAISSIVGLDDSMKITLASTVNTLTGADSVEFVLKRESDNAIFWIVKAFTGTRIYTLTSGDNAALANGNTYRIAAMFQPAAANALYSAPSAVSTSLTGAPSNLPNGASSIVLTSNATGNVPRLNATWVRPTDFADWSGQAFTIELRLQPSTGSDINVVLNTDLVAHQFEALDRGVTYALHIKYVNVNGEGPEISSGFQALTTTPDAPTMVSVTTEDTQSTLTWSQPAYIGQTALTSYEVYKDNVLLFTGVNPALLSYVAVGLTNGVTYAFKVLLINAVGSSALSNEMSILPHGVMSIQSVVAVGKTLTMTMVPNGNPINYALFFAIDSNPNELKADMMFEFLQADIPQNLTGTVVVAKTFSNLSNDIQKYIAIATDSNGGVKYVSS